MAEWDFTLEDKTNSPTKDPQQRLARRVHLPGLCVSSSWRGAGLPRRPRWCMVSAVPRESPDTRVLGAECCSESDLLINFVHNNRTSTHGRGWSGWEKLGTHLNTSPELRQNLNHLGTGLGLGCCQNIVRKAILAHTMAWGNRKCGNMTLITILSMGRATIQCKGLTFLCFCMLPHTNCWEQVGKEWKMGTITDATRATLGLELPHSTRHRPRLTCAEFCFCLFPEMPLVELLNFPKCWFSLLESQNTNSPSFSGLVDD